MSDKEGKPMTSKGTCCVYCRISRDAEQEGLGVARQEADCRALAKRRNLKVVAVYTDNDISASVYSKKARPEYNAMLDAARAHEFDVIVAYDNSRITRRNEELEDLVKLFEQTSVPIYTVVSGDDDLSTADGRMNARIKATVASHSSEKTSERLRRKFLEKAQNGAVNQGTRAFGWADDKKKLHPKEARLLRKAIADIIDGVSTHEVARHWNDAGVTTVPHKVRGEDGEVVKDKDGEFVRRGHAWNHTNVRQVLRNSRLAGWRTHQGSIARNASGEPVRGVWTPMVGQDTFDQLQQALDGRQPKTRRGAQRYLLSTLMRCGVCGKKCHGFRTKQGHAYACSSEGKGHSVTIAGVQTDALIVALVEQRLASIDLSAAPVKPAEWAGEARLRQISVKIPELMAAFNAGTLSGAIVFPQVGALEKEQATLQGERPSTARRLVVASADAFPTLEIDRQRAIVDSLIETVVVAKAERRGAPWTPDRLEVVWRA